MNETNLTDVLEEYALAAGGENDLNVLRQMTEKFPQYAADLQDFAAARAVLKYAPAPEISAADETRFHEIGLRNLRLILNVNTVSQKSLVSLTDSAKAKGLNRKSFAAALGLSVSLVQYLEKKRLAFATIPPKVIAKIAAVLETSEEAIAVYLNQLQDSGAQTSFKTETRAEEMPPKDFAEAVREDQTLSAEEKRKLLEL